MQFWRFTSVEIPYNKLMCVSISQSLLYHILLGLYLVYAMSKPMPYRALGIDRDEIGNVTNL